MDDFQVNGKASGICGKEGCQAVVDTGSSMLMAPPNMVAQIEKALDVKEDCSNFDQLPTLGFTFQGQTFNLKPEDYIDSQINPDTGSMGCWLGLLPVPDTGKGPLVVLGYPFLRQVYTVLDAGKTPRVGFASQKKAGAKDQNGALHLRKVLPTVDALVGSSENLRKEVMKKEEKEVRASDSSTNSSNATSTSTSHLRASVSKGNAAAQKL